MIGELVGKILVVISLPVAGVVVISNLEAGRGIWMLAGVLLGLVLMFVGLFLTRDDG